MKNLIFEDRLLAPMSQRIGWTFFTVFFWMVWLYLLLPLFTLFLWSLGLISYVRYFGWMSFLDLGQVLHTARVYGIVVLLLGGSLLLWARVEFMRFRDRSRRGVPVSVNNNEIAEYMQLPAEKIELWKGARRVVVRHDSHGNLDTAHYL